MNRIPVVVSVTVLTSVALAIGFVGALYAVAVVGKRIIKQRWA